MAKIRKGWQKRAIVRSCGEQINLESLEGYWIVPQKLSLDVMQQITDGQGIDIDEDTIQEKSEEEVKKAIEDAYKKRGKSKFSLSDENFQTMLRLAFLYGVYDHNFDAVVDKDNKAVPLSSLDAMSDAEFDKRLNDKDIKVIKVNWDETLYKRIRDFPETLFEIFKIVMGFNRPLQKETSEK